MKRIPAGAIAANNKKSHEESIRSGQWFHGSVSFDPCRYLDDKYKGQVTKLFELLRLNTGYKTDQKLKDFEVLLANLLHQTLKPISISLNKNDWKLTKYNKTSYFTVQAIVPKLFEQKLIGMKKGYNVEEDSRMTRIWATDKLLQEFPEYKTGVLWKPSELIILRDEHKKLLDYKDTRETWRIRTILQRVNEVNGKADIRYHTRKINAFLVAIYTEKLTWYGRLHTRGFQHAQGFSGEEREEFTINNESVVERDFSALHPNLLYAAEGIQYRGDPYAVVNDNPIARPFLKEVLLRMLNAADVRQAESASNYWLKQNPDERDRLLSIGISRARPVIDNFSKVHQPISKYFFNGKKTGMRIMHLDARIACEIVDYFARQGKPIVPYHDSFVVQSRYDEELVQMMQKTYSRHTGGFSIKIK